MLLDSILFNETVAQCFFDVKDQLVKNIMPKVFPYASHFKYTSTELITRKQIYLIIFISMPIINLSNLNGIPKEFLKELEKCDFFFYHNNFLEN